VNRDVSGQWPRWDETLRTFKTDMVLSRQRKPDGRRKPLIVHGRRRRRSLTPGRVALLGAGALAAFLWYGVIGDDLGTTPVDTAVQTPTPPPTSAAVVPAAAPAEEATATGTLAAAQTPQPTQVWRALLHVARDHVTRRVYAAWGSVMDLEAMRGADVDMIERALATLDFPLRAAVVRHRFQEPKRYGLKRQPPATLAERRRALTPENLRIFFDVFATSLPVDALGADGGWAPGDIVLFSTSASGRPLMAGVVSDKDDEDGVSLLITLDPRDQVALESRSLADYHLRHRFRLTRSHLDRCQKRLELPPLRIDGTLLL